MFLGSTTTTRQGFDSIFFRCKSEGGATFQHRKLMYGTTIELNRIKAKIGACQYSTVVSFFKEYRWCFHPAVYRKTTFTLLGENTSSPNPLFSAVLRLRSVLPRKRNLVYCIVIYVWDTYSYLIRHHKSTGKLICDSMYLDIITSSRIDLHFNTTTVSLAHYKRAPCEHDCVHRQVVQFKEWSSGPVSLLIEPLHMRIGSETVHRSTGVGFRLHT